MATREELLSGVIKVNNETIDRESLEDGSKGEVSGGGGSEEAAPSGGHSRDEAATQGVLSKPKESLHEFVERRATEVVSEMEELRNAIEEAESKLNALRSERATLALELKALEKLSG